jgi:arginyl-tRNA synthetase
MKTIIQVLTDIVSEAFEQYGYDAKLGRVLVSDRADLCQFQCNGAFAGAKMYKKAPALIAGEVAAKLKDNDIFRKAEAVNGFINLDVSDAFLTRICLELYNDPGRGVPQEEQPKTILLDYGGPNIAKPLHIGHLRAAIIGEALKNLMRRAGNRVIGDVHLGDWGLQMGLVIAELEERGIDDISSITADLLNEIYPAASRRSKTDEEFKNKAHKITAEFQSGNEKYLTVLKKITETSIPDLKENYKRLNVSFDLWNGESDADKYTGELLEILKQKNLLQLSDGALVADVSEPEDKTTIPPVIIKKSDGSSNYATTDLATILQRQKDYNPDKIWYVVDQRQSLHFTQVFRCARKAGIVSERTELEHLGFGTMNGRDGKPFKTRDGGVMQLSEFLDTAIQRAYEKLDSANYASETDRYAVAKKISLAAIKFGDMLNNRIKDYVFDLDKFLSFEGKTGVYLLYTVTRINSILRKCGVSDTDIRLCKITGESERKLLLAIAMCGEAFRYAIEEKAPNCICEGVYTIAESFSAFYHENHILSETDAEKKNTWISMCLMTKRCIETHLDILGIEAVEYM